MRNLFDQYDQPENKLTHALVCTLQSDRKLIRPFLEWLKILNIPKNIQVVEQQVPGEPISGNEDESNRLPDACFFDNDGWAVLVESKVQAGVSHDQLIGYFKTAKKRAYKNVKVVLISVERPKTLPENVCAKEWREVYKWFDEQARSLPDPFWAQTFVDYMRVFESKMIAKDYKIEGTITMFNGIYFNKEKPYTYREAKILIRLLKEELLKCPKVQDLGVNPKEQGKRAITGSSQDYVWDYLSLKKARNFTNFPHLTIDLSRSYALAAVTVPNGIKGGFRNRLNKNGVQSFQDLISTVEKNLRSLVEQTGAKPIIYVHQRHFKTRSSPQETDAKLEVDLRTLVPKTSSKSGVKYQPQWIKAIYDVLCNKKSNIQLGIEVRFPYEESKNKKKQKIAPNEITSSRKIIEAYADAWIAMKPLLDFALQG